MIHNYNEPKYKNRRKNLLRTLTEKGIRDTKVLAAIEAVPRHLFIDSAFADSAYEDCALPIGFGQTISQPYTVARQTELLAPQPGERILEIGTGSGYQTAILCQLDAFVYSIERFPQLYQVSGKRLRTMGYRKLMLKSGDGTLGWAAYAPFNGIIVTAGAPVVPETLKQQLADGGRLIIPVGNNTTQTMLRITRIGDDFSTEEFSSFTFVPLIGHEGWNNSST
ncbi:MAG: protein-L-isoaspartate(D-aspartate) O-methyltransferase [Balneolales bacterium]|nr:protein-L-isoaspartate(D-aspartate) O-methyltransferase [Balneolales bacterium]